MKFRTNFFLSFTFALALTEAVSATEVHPVVETEYQNFDIQGHCSPLARKFSIAWSNGSTYLTEIRYTLNYDFGCGGKNWEPREEEVNELLNPEAKTIHEIAYPACRGGAQVRNVFLTITRAIVAQSN